MRQLMGLFDRFRRPASDSAPSRPLIRYRSADVTTVPIGGQRVLLHQRGSTAPPRIVAEFAADALRRCGAWKTIDEHAQDLGPDAAGIAALEVELAALAADGFLLAEPAPTPQLPAVRRIERVGMLTQARDACARRCVDSIIAAAEHFARPRELTIADDDPLGDQARRIPSLVSRSSGAVRLRYAGRPEKWAYLAKLASESGVEPALLEYALFGPEGSTYTAGANHNALLFDAIGDRILTVDDDTCGRMTRVPGVAGPSAELRSGAETTTLFLYPDIEAAIAAATFEDVDPLAIHEVALGVQLVEALARAAGDQPVKVEAATPRLYAELDRPEAKVGVTSVGLCGDSGMSSPSYYLFLKGEPQARLFADYERLRTTRALIRATPGLVITDGNYLMTPHTAFDLEVIVPPHHPVGRNADGIFGTVLRSVSPHRYIAHLPWAVEHRPESRSYPLEALYQGPTRIGFADILLSCVQGCAYPPGAVSSEARLSVLGEHLIGIADLPGPERDEWLRLRRFQQLSRTTIGLAAILDQGPGPAEYLADVERALALAEAALTSRTVIQPLDLGRAEQVPELLRQYGRLLCSWPTIWGAAARLAASGVRVSAPVESSI